MIVRALLLLAVLLASGCGNMFSAEETKTAHTEHQRDSVLARSALPGSRVVGRALHESDRAGNRAADIDSIVAR